MGSVTYRFGVTMLFVLLVFSAISTFAQTAAVKRNSNLRKSASSASTIIELLPAGTQVTLTSTRKRSGYYHVHAQDGKVGWVYARNVTISAVPTPSPTATPSSTATASPTATPSITATPASTATISPTAAPSTPLPGGTAFDPGCTLPFEAIKQKHPIIDDTCSIDGEKSGGGTPPASKVAENHAKNNFCLTGTPIDISYQDLLQLEGDTKQIVGASLPSAAARKTKLGSLLDLNGQKIGEGTLVRITLFVIQGAAEYADTAPKYNGESVNCNRLTPDENDIHIPLGQQATDEETASVTAEISPHYRPTQWTPDRINNVGQHPVRVTGQLFYDSAHRTANGGRTGSPRASLWEIHPVYAFEVCQLTDTAQCEAAPESSWLPLDQFTP